LGLYVARQIATLHGGSIHIEDPERPGARFVVDLPADGERLESHLRNSDKLLSASGARHGK